LITNQLVYRMWLVALVDFSRVMSIYITGHLNRGRSMSLLVLRLKKSAQKIYSNRLHTHQYRATKFFHVHLAAIVSRLLVCVMAPKQITEPCFW